MWKIFKADPLSKIDRRKTLAEKKRIRSKKKAWRRKKRGEAWKSFQKGLKNFVSNPFAKRNPNVAHWNSGFSVLDLFDPKNKFDRRKTKAEKRHRQSRARAWRRRERALHWQETRTRINKFLANPFAKRELTPEQREYIRIRKAVKRDRQLERAKWWAKFKKRPLRAIFPRKKRRVEGGGYLYVYEMTKEERRELALKQRKEAFQSFKLVFTTPDLRKRLSFSFIHSLTYFLLAFIFLNFIHQVITIMVASSFHLPVVWFMNKLTFPLDRYSHLYTRSALILTFGIGPFIALVLAFLFLKMFSTKDHFFRKFQLFYVWGFVCGMNLFFGAYIVGFLTHTEFVFASEWIFLTNLMGVQQIVGSVLSLFIMLLLSRFVTPLFLMTSSSVSLITSQFRVYFILFQVIFPWMAGMFILCALSLPSTYFAFVLKTMTPGLVLIPILARFKALKYDKFAKAGMLSQISFGWGMVVIVFALLVAYRFVLAGGLRV